MRSLAIVGPGVLGLSLARHAAERGMTVRLVGRDRAHAENGLQKIVTSWKRRLNEGRLNLDAFRLLTTRLGTSDTPKEAIQDAFALVEALPEELQLKQTF
ncbi:MAG: 3-hydroxyacyl-CoA dehydrogenase NAD-binding domain-containing protein, partial [Holophaga sp.]|nr:3-hydroxyacyl-CoA dehydrogenase NAD-binding domain-containing protein [Holophaga sp.]